VVEPVAVSTGPPVGQVGPAPPVLGIPPKPPAEAEVTVDTVVVVEVPPPAPPPLEVLEVEPDVLPEELFVPPIPEEVEPLFPPEFEVDSVEVVLSVVWPELVVIGSG
jgi:hypothetical protein